MDIDAMDWTLTCCNNSQIISICLIVAYALVILKLWRIPVIHPFKILTVFLHELGHATAVWMTCGRVTGMEVHPNEGGVTKHVGGVALIILPAGYLGSAFWGMGLVIASADQLASEIIAGVLVFFLLVFIYFAGNTYLRVLNCAFIVLLVGFLVINITTDYNWLEYITLFMGVMSCLFSIYDIWDDLISRRVNESDATKFAEMTHTSSRCWGVIWGIIALSSLGGAVYFNLLILQEKSEEIKSFEDLDTGSTTAFVIACVVFGLSVIHTLIWKSCMVNWKSNSNNNYYISSI